LIIYHEKDYDRKINRQRIREKVTTYFSICMLESSNNMRFYSAGSAEKY